MLGIRDGQLSLSLVKVAWRGEKRSVSCNGDGKAFYCVILFTTIPCQGLLKQAFLLLMHKLTLVWQIVQSLGSSHGSLQRLCELLVGEDYK